MNVADCIQLLTLPRCILSLRGEIVDLPTNYKHFLEVPKNSIISGLVDKNK